MTQDRRSFLQFLALAPVVAVVPPAQATALTIADVHRCRDVARSAEAQQFANQYWSQMLRIVNETAKGGIIANG